MQELGKDLELSEFIKLPLANLNKVMCLFKTLIQNAVCTSSHAGFILTVY